MSLCQQAWGGDDPITGLTCSHPPSLPGPRPRASEQCCPPSRLPGTGLRSPRGRQAWSRSLTHPGWLVSLACAGGWSWPHLPALRLPLSAVRRSPRGDGWEGTAKTVTVRSDGGVKWQQGPVTQLMGQLGVFLETLILFYFCFWREGNWVYLFIYLNGGPGD